MHDTRAAWRRRYAKVRLFAHTVHDLGLRTVGQVVANSVRRQRARRAEAAVRDHPGPAMSPGALEGVTDTATGARFDFTQATLDVDFVSDDMVRLSWGPGVDPVGYAVVDPLPWTPPAVSAEAAPDGGRVLGTSSLAVAVAADGSVRLARPGGDELRSWAPPVRRGTHWDQRATLRAGERCYGLGQQAGGLELGGRRFRLWNRDPGGAWGTGQMPMYLCMPVLLTTHTGGGLLCFYENSTYATVSVGNEDSGSGDGPADVSVSFTGGVLRQYVTVGDPPALLERFSALTGRPALPPRWALGYHQSRWGYKRDDHVHEVLQGYRAVDVPLSAVHLDIDYMRGYRVFTIDHHRFPDLAALAHRAGDQGVRLVTIIDPAVKVDHHYPLFSDGVAKGRFCTDPGGRVEVGVVWPGRAAFPDFTDPDTRAWWASQYRMLIEAGVSGIWHDMNEPTSISLSGDPTLPLATRHDFDGRGGDHGEGHNLYGLLMNRAGYEGLRQAAPERRPFIVSRSGWASGQRHAWNWTGDVESTWSGLRQQVATIVGLGLSGIPYSGPDIGGFSGVPDDELYLRWMQLSVLLPFCRTHSVVGAPPREPWRFDEPARSAIVSWIRLRYRLLPYLYTLAHEASARGTPLVRPLWWPPPAGLDAAVDGSADGTRSGGPTDDAYLLGDALLVAPVCEPGATARAVTLPPGRWRSWWAADAAQRDELEARHEITTPLERIGVLVRAGSIVPLDDGWAEPGGHCALEHDDPIGARPPGAVSLDHAPRLLALHCWPSAGRASGTVVDDAGDGDGATRRDELVLSGAVEGGRAVLRWTHHGQHPLPERVRVVVHGLHVEAAHVDGAPVSPRGAVVECGPFEALELDGLRPVTPAPVP